MDQTVAEARDAFGEAKAKRDDSQKDADVLAAAIEAFKTASEAESENRKEALDDLKFARLGEQWPEKERTRREQAGRPCLTINKLPAFSRQVVNAARQNRPSIKVSPVEGGDVPTAHVYTGLIRNIEHTSNAEVAYDTALESAVDSAWGYLRVNLVYASDDSFEQDLRIERIADKTRVYGDWRSEAADTADWNIAFVTDMMSLDAFRRQYKGAEPSDWDGGDLYRSIPEQWREGTEVRVAEYWTRTMVPGEIVLLKRPDGSQQIVDAKVLEREAATFQAAGWEVAGQRNVKRPKVTQHILSGAEVLEKHDWVGKYIPLSICLGDEVHVEGKRYLRSLIRDAKDPQRMFNYWRTMSTELIALAPKAPWIGPKGVFSVDPNWETANDENHSILEYDGKVAAQGGPPQRQPFTGVPAGALQEALNASDDMKSIIGLYDASLGARSNETSGVAINARQREGDVSTFHFIDNLGRCIRHTGRILIDLIPKVYTAGRMIRVLGVDGKPQNVKLGQEPQTITLPSGKPHTGVFDLAAGKYDLTVDAGPSYTTRRQETAVQMMEFVRAFPGVVPLIGDLIAKAMDWEGAEEIGERLRAMLPPQLQGQNPQVEAMKQQMQQMDAHAREAVTQLQEEIRQKDEALQKATSNAEVQRIKAEAEKLDKELQAKQLLVSIYDAVTKRMQAGLPVTPGTEGDPEMAHMAQNAEAQVAASSADQNALAQQSTQALQMVVEAVGQMVEQLSQPREVLRDPETGLVTHH